MQGLGGYISNSGRMPRLARAYVDVHRKHGESVWVQPKEFEAFAKFEHELRKMGVSAKEYASFTVSTYLEYIRSKGQRRIPTRMFLSDAALKRYLDYVSDTGRTGVEATADEILLAKEYEYAQMYIGSTISGGSYTREEAVPILGSDWYTALQDEGVRALYQERITEMLRNTHALFLNGSTIKSYDDVAYRFITWRSEDD